MTIKSLSALVLIVALFAGLSCNAQKTVRYNTPESLYRSARELFENQKYSSAEALFLQVVGMEEEAITLLPEASFYSAMCAAQLFRNDAEDQLNSFIVQYPQHSLVPQATFALAGVRYNKRNYRGALQAFEQINVFQLEKNQRPEYYFKSGYCSLKTGDLATAKATFYEIKEGQSLYTAPARYYYAHINYEEGNYETAHKSFVTLLEDEDFQDIVPHYLIRIYFAQEKYEEVIEMASAISAEGNDPKSMEIKRLVGESYYHLGDFESALPWLEKTADASDRQRGYQLGYCYYQARHYDEAISWFERVSSPADSLAQNALYHLGDCYVKTGQKKFAGTAFKAAYAIEGNQLLREDALFNYAKLSFELGYDPYNEAIKAMQEYLSDYPDSPRKDEAYSYLVNLFLVTKNYDDAFSSLEQIKEKNAEMKKAYQQITFSRAIQLFKSGQYEEAIPLLKKSLEYKQDPELAARAIFWEAEAFFRMGNYGEAMRLFKSFMVTPGTYSLNLYPKAAYNIAYCYFKEKDYSNALINFRKFLSLSGVQDIPLKADALIRTGDCFFVEKRYEEAINAFNQAIEMDAGNTDYALYQKAVSLGALGNFSGKAWILKQLVQQAEKSPLRDDAMFELATSYILMNEPDNALQYYQMLYQEYPKSSFALTALQKTGLIYYNQNNNEEAIRVLKQVIEAYPSSQEAKESLAGLRNIYVDMGRVDEYFTYARNYSYADISLAEQDSISFIAAENKYMDGDCDRAIEGFTRYLEKFPNGIFASNAHYYKADCEYRNSNLPVALSHYEAVIAMPQSPFTENALVKASSIRFAREEFEKAIAHYNELLELASFPEHILNAKVGLMRSYPRLGKHEPAIEAALEVLNEKNVDERLITEAHLSIARSAYALNDYTNASAEYRFVATNDRGDSGAEANYFYSLILFKENKIDEAENQLFNLIENFSASDYWFARAFILLADVYLARDNTFQAKQTLQSIIDNYEGEDLVAEAKDKLNHITELENRQKPDSIPENTLRDSLIEEF
ncbi:MAG: tetratricopeptide repeat protein [Bacteroidales bacterium]|nr:tetratricopeptide repeat protein [Bacteroidales bacterium]HPE86386.1 tetratricopeptide repeat protein [Bacteroidales bacterium]